MSAGRRRGGTRAVVTLLVAALVVFARANAASAATWDVTSSADDGSPGTLRSVIANAGAGDTVVIDPGVEPVLTQGSIGRQSDLSIVGQGARQTTVTGTGFNRIFDLTAGPSFGNPGTPTNVSITGLTITGALDSAISVSGFNGYFASGSLTLTDVAISGNSAVQGAGVAMCDTTLTATRVTFANDAATDGSGGAVLVCDDSNYSSSVNLTDTTVTATGGLGDALHFGVGSTVSLVNDTIAGNPRGNIGSAGQVTLQNTIIAGGASQPGGNCSGSGYIDAGGNLEDSAPSQCGLSAAQNIIGANPLLGARANNGGQTDTMALQQGSPAIDAVSSSNCPVSTDQRSLPRPDNLESQCDTGAYEVQDPVPVGVSCTPSTAVPGLRTTCTATVNGPGVSPTGNITFSSTSNGSFGGGATCALAGSGGTASCAVTYTPASVGSETISTAYSGDSVYAQGSGSTTLIVTSRSVTGSVACAPATLEAGTMTTCTVTVADASLGQASVPTGTVTFSGGQPGSLSPSSCTLVSGGTAATCLVYYVPASSGARSFAMSYGGDGTHGGVGASATVVAFTPAIQLGVSCSPGTVSLGGTTDCVATVTGGANRPSGYVQFSSSTGGFPAGSRCLLRPQGRIATCNVHFRPARTHAPGTYQVVAQYSGDAFHSSQSATTSVASPPVAGVSGNIAVISGVIFVAVPAPKAAHDARSRSSGPLVFVPLKGRTVSIPVGSTIDARKGIVALSTSADYLSAADSQHSMQSGQFQASMFTIKQLSARQAFPHLIKGLRRRRPSTDLLLDTPAGAIRQAGCRRHGAPGKGVVRSIFGVANGLYRTIGAASITTVKGSATWRVNDRCDGTLTEIGRGRAIVTVPAHGVRRRSVALTAGEAVLVKARFLMSKIVSGLPSVDTGPPGPPTPAWGTLR